MPIEDTFQTHVLFAQEADQELVHVLICLGHKPFQCYEYANDFTGPPVL